MNAVQAIWKDGRIVPVEAVDWPEGTDLVVEPVSVPHEKIGLMEAEWRDDAQALARWQAWLQTLEPTALTAEERAANEQFETEFEKFNREAVDRQMKSEDGR